MKGTICDLCAKPTASATVVGMVIQADYCKTCAVEVQKLYDEIGKLQEKLQAEYGAGLLKLVAKLNKRFPDGTVPDFAWIKSV